MSPQANRTACRSVIDEQILTDVGCAYSGGPGSNYSCHGLCAVVERLRTDHYRGELGVVGANGGMLTEHGVGIYSTAPPKETYSRRDYHGYAPDPHQLGGGLRTTAEFAFNPSGMVSTQAKAPVACDL